MLKKVTSGQPIDIKASDWNAMLEAAQAEIDRRHSAAGSTLHGGLSFGIVLARNAAGEPLAPGQPVVLDGFSLQPADAVNATRLTLRVALPAEEDSRPLAVVIDPCSVNELARVRVAGSALVRPARAPAPDEQYVSFGPEGMLLPSEFGQARILAANPDIAMILLGDGNPGEPTPKGMFQLVNVTSAGGPPTVRICDGASPQSAIAGVATVNSQSYSCPAAEFTLTEAPQYFYFRFTPPRHTSGGEQTASVCDLVAVADAEAVVSTDRVFYRLIGHAWTETVDDKPIVKIAQDHRPGNLIVTWQGPCIGLLEGIVEE